MLSVSALMLTACGDDGDNGDDEANGDDTAAEETTEETAEDEEAETDEDEADVDEPAEEDDAEEEGSDPFAGDVLTEEEITELLLTEDEFPVEFEQFMPEQSLSDSMPLPDQDLISTCEEYAEYFQNPEALEAEADVEVTGASNAGMFGEQMDPSMLQVAIMTYSDDAASADFRLIQECEGETFSSEVVEGQTMDVSFEYLTYQDWEGMSMLTSTSGIDTEVDMLVYQDGTTEILVMAMGEGEQYLEEVADLQLEKYQSGS